MELELVRGEVHVWLELDFSGEKILNFCCVSKISDRVWGKHGGALWNCRS